jgi:dihydroorotate dehydrogenase (fumarate)
MADLSTKYMGLKLSHPIVPGASPLSKTIDGIKELEDAGAPAIVLYSVFEEQFKLESGQLDHFLASGTESFGEALSYFPNHQDYNLGPEEYLEHIRKAKQAASIPIIASLNGLSPSGWADYARDIQMAGADGIELNIYYLPANPALEGAEIEKRYLEVIKSVKGAVTVPVAMKLSPFFSSISNMAARLSEEGADALVLFNRFYQPDININDLMVEPQVVLSTSHDKYLPMRWIAILYGRVSADFASSTGVHYTEDVVRMLMAGASMVQVTSVLLEKGPSWISDTVNNLMSWMEKREYKSMEEIIGLMSQKKCAEPSAFERANYMKALVNYG